MSPVPLKKQSMAGTSILKLRGERSVRAVEPTIDMFVGESGKRTEVTIICGIRWVLCNFAIASWRVSREVILVSESSLGPIA